MPGGPFRGRMFRGAQRRRAWAGQGPDPPRTRGFGLGCRVQVPGVSFPGERGAGRVEEAAGTGDGVPRWGCKSQAGRHGGLSVPRVAGTWRRLCPSFAARGVGGLLPAPSLACRGPGRAPSGPDPVTSCSQLRGRASPTFVVSGARGKAGGRYSFVRSHVPGSLVCRGLCRGAAHGPSPSDLCDVPTSSHTGRVVGHSLGTGGEPQLRGRVSFRGNEHSGFGSACREPPPNKQPRPFAFQGASHALGEAEHRAPAPVPGGPARRHHQ